MILTYSLTCPVGIAVGMAIAETYDPDSTRSRGVQGAFNGVSGGMLLYIALVQVRVACGSRVVGVTTRDLTACRQRWCTARQCHRPDIVGWIRGFVRWYSFVSRSTGVRRSVGPSVLLIGFHWLERGSLLWL